jgi:hypothetical protein
MAPNTVLDSGQHILSCDGRFLFAMQADGNLVLYQLTTPWAYVAGDPVLWRSNTWNSPGAYVTMQGDGNLVVYDTSNNPIWASNTWGWDGASLSIQADGNVVIYFGSRAIWATNTCCH